MRGSFLLLLLLLKGTTSKLDYESGDHGHKLREPHEENYHKHAKPKPSGHQLADEHFEEQNHKHDELEESPDGRNECRIREYGKHHKVCVCDSDHCDTIPRPQREDKSKFILYTSSRDGLRFHKSIGLFRPFQRSQHTNEIYLNPDNTLQRVFGFGGAFTDATGINILSLNEETRRLLMRSYFSDDGIEYSLCRIPIGGTDFSTRFYTYDDTDHPDPELKHFVLQQEDFDYKIPFIKQALELRGDDSFRLFGSTWAAPVWMKTNDQFTDYGFIKEEFFQAWADYFVKFLEAYEENGIDIWGITTQNEPSLGVLQIGHIPTVGWSSYNLTIWVRDNLGPAIKKSRYPDTILMILDDQKFFLPWYTNTVLEDQQALQYVSGIAIHWYFNSYTSCRVVDESHSEFPDIFILSTEACTGSENSTGVKLGSWERGEKYTTDIIQNMNCWVVGWVDWNMVLNLQGGPTLIDNFVDSPIVVNETGQEFYKQPMYYHFGHHSKFVPKDSMRIEWSGTLQNDVLATAYRRPDGGVVVVILNKNDADVMVKVIHEAVGVAALFIRKRSVNTLLYWFD